MNYINKTEKKKGYINGGRAALSSTNLLDIRDNELNEKEFKPPTMNYKTIKKEIDSNLFGRQ